MSDSSNGIEDLDEVLRNLNRSEAKAAQTANNSWVPSNTANRMSRSLQSLDSSLKSEQGSSHLYDTVDPIYTSVDELSWRDKQFDRLDSPSCSNMAESRGHPFRKPGRDERSNGFLPQDPRSNEIGLSYAFLGKGKGYPDPTGHINQGFTETEPSSDLGKSLKPDYNDDSDDSVDEFPSNHSPKSVMKKSGFHSNPKDSLKGFPKRRSPVSLNTYTGSQGKFLVSENYKPASNGSFLATQNMNDNHEVDTKDPLNLSDLAKLPELTLETITDCIETRFKNDKIYTWCGNILISVNPFKPMEICTAKYHEDYTYAKIDDRPHLFAVSAKAYQGVRELSQNQVILVSGESGAGKTEATKLMVQHLMTIGGSEYHALQDRIIKINPLLEAFGNAKTRLNHNSSRFAKFLCLYVNERGKIESARVKDYMLEKSRVVYHAHEERTFHAFYALLVGAPEDTLASLYLERNASYRITSGADQRPITPKEEVLYKHIYQEQQQVFELIKLTEEEIQDVHTILAAVLHIGNVDFEEADHDSVNIKNEDVVEQAAILLQLDAERLTKALIERRGRMGKDRHSALPLHHGGAGARSKDMSTRGFGNTTQRASLPIFEDEFDHLKGELIELSKNIKQADDERDALAKSLYERMFGWLVRKINDSLKSNAVKDNPSIGILDICGFENLPHNSFEQLCINIVNEQLQNFMNEQVIENEKEMYKSEQVKITDVDTTGINNDAILQMFMEKKNGMLAMIDEDSKIEISNDERLVGKLANMYQQTGHFIQKGPYVPEFTIKHFAGEVSYDARSFIKKNRDTLSEDMMECLLSSQSPLIQDLFTVEESHTGSISMTAFNFRGSKKPSVRGRPPIVQRKLSMSINRSRPSFRFGDKKPDIYSVDSAKKNTHIKFFRNSLNELIRAMREAYPFFVRCIKPNDRLKPSIFSKDRVMMQLQYNGVKEVARIRTFGFPCRSSKKDFVLKYKDIAANQPDGTTAIGIFRAINADQSQYKIGNSQVFMKEHVKKVLDSELAELRRKAEEERRRKQEEERKRKEEEARRKQKEEEEERERKMNKTGAVRPNGKFSTLERSVRFGPLDSIGEVPTPASSRDDVIYQSVNNSSSSNETKSLDTDGNSEEEESGDEKKEEDEEKEESHKLNAAWDITQELTEEEERKDVHEQPVLMVIKFIVYILLFLVILGALICQKMGLLILLQNLRQAPEAVLAKINKSEGEKLQTVSLILLAVAICLPYGIGWIITVVKLCFGNFKNPSKWTWMWVFLVENMHSAGICLLVFRVLPRLDVIKAAMLLTGTALIPSICKVGLSSPLHDTRSLTGYYKQIIKVSRAVFDTIAMAGQISVIPLLLLEDYITDADITSDFQLTAEIVGALFLVSVSHWENFVDGRLFCELSEENKFKNIILKIRYEMQMGRHFPHILTYVWKIGLTWLLAYLLRGDISFDTAAFTELDLSAKPKFFSAVIALTISAFVAFYVSFGACMFQMQIVSLSMPLLLVTPATIGMFILNDHYEFLSAVTSPDVVFPHFQDVLSWKHILMGGAWFISFFILTRHMWRPQVDRTASMARIFVDPGYCGILTAESIMLNRRRHQCKVVRNLDMNEEGDIRAKYYKIRPQRKTKTEDEAEDSDSDTAEAKLEDVEATITEEREKRKDEESLTTPMLYACATMWHETRIEMVQLLKSLHRLDRDQYIRRIANQKVKGFDPDFYNFEAHIFFDDAMELDDDNERVPNSFVKDLVNSMDVACSSVHGKPMRVHPPTKVPTPYGGQLIWQMPGENLLFVHMKDMSKIRNRKRWSQVMYMYYLLGYRHIMSCKNELLEKMKKINANLGNHGLNITEINYLLGETAAARSQNTFLLALDGDTDFSPGSIKLLLDRMKDENVGAACGRIHPIGNGPMIWYQKFEYAIGHWLQKAAEHVFGCVLCSPGCFSLFRAAALMDTNVMKKYTTEPTEPGHHLQYDQGEDRWLCTLMLQQGYRIEYAAGADAWTFAPEGFFEFFNQRRRWMPSTLANILDLLGSASTTTKRNPNVSVLYIGYQWLLMLMTVLGPGTILMMIAGAVKLVFQWSLIESYLFATIPAGIYTFICFWFKSRIQLIVAAMLSVLYTFIMMIVLVGTIITATTENLFHPSVIVIVMLVGIFVISGICHPKEVWCLIHGVMYLLVIPSGYLLLVIFSIVNLNDVSWGTREVPTKAQRIENERKKKEKEEAKRNKPKKGIMAKIFNRGEEHIKELTNLIKTLVPEKHTAPGNLGMAVGPQDTKVVELLSKIDGSLEKLLKQKCNIEPESLDSVVVSQPEAKEVKKKPSIKLPPPTAPKPEVAEPVKQKKEKKKKKKERNELINPLWSEDKGLGKGETIQGNEAELQFWQEFVTKYLLPIKPTQEEKKKIADGLRELRNSASFGLIIINLLWMALNFMFQFTNAARFQIDYSYGGSRYELEESILGLSFVGLLLLLLLIQMMGMFIHRMGTLQHLLAITEIRLGKSKKTSASTASSREEAIRHIKEVLRLPQNQDPGAVTEPPVLAPRDNHLGVTFVGGSTRGSVGMGMQQDNLAEEIGKSMRRMGPILDARRNNVHLGQQSRITLEQVRKRLTSGQALDKLKDNFNLEKSIRPVLPPRGRRQPTFAAHSSNWGFTQKDLEEFNPIMDHNDNARMMGNHHGAMGKTLFQRTRIINELTKELSPANNETLAWDDRDLARTRSKRQSRSQRFNTNNRI